MATSLTLQFYDHPMSVWQLCLPTSFEHCGDSNMRSAGRARAHVRIHWANLEGR